MSGADEEALRVARATIATLEEEIVRLKLSVVENEAYSFDPARMIELAVFSLATYMGVNKRRDMRRAARGEKV